METPLNALQVLVRFDVLISSHAAPWLSLKGWVGSENFGVGFFGLKKMTYIQI